MRIWTVGHSNRDVDDLITLLAEAGARRLADVRAFPASRRHPQFNEAALARSLAAAGIDYCHLSGLGGRRGAGQLTGPSPNGGWREEAFRNYADYALTSGFVNALAELRALAAERPTAIMCAEREPQQCHRRIIADYLIAGGDEVIHLIDASRMEQGALTEGARVVDEGIHYPPAQGELFQP